MSEDNGDAVGGPLGRVVHSAAAHAAGALVVLFVAILLVSDAASTTAMAHHEGRALGPLGPLWIPLVYLWASVLWGLLAAWLWRTSLPEVTGEGWTKVRQLLWVEWVTQALRWVAVVGLLNLGVLTTMAWTRWFGLAFGFESAVFGTGSDWVIFVPIAVGALLVAARSVVAFRRGRASA